MDHCIHRERSFVRLAEEGIEHIGTAAFERGIEAINGFQKQLNAFHVSKCRIVGTAALRSADNSSDFIKEVKENTGLSIEVIEGEQEAHYIYKGIASIVPMDTDNFLIMDIGGGSVEFILLSDGELVQSRSYNIGISQMFSKLEHSYPIKGEERTQILAYIKEHIKSLTPYIEQIPIKAVIGASGSFEVLEAMYQLEVKEGYYNLVTGSEFLSKAEEVYKSSMDVILAHPAIPASRAKLITMAFLLIECILEISRAQFIYISPAAMKEGILSEMDE